MFISYNLYVYVHKCLCVQIMYKIDIYSFCNCENICNHTFLINYKENINYIKYNKYNIKVYKFK